MQAVDEPKPSLADLVTAVLKEVAQRRVKRNAMVSETSLVLWIAPRLGNDLKRSRDVCRTAFELLSDAGFLRKIAGTNWKFIQEYGQDDANELVNWDGITTGFGTHAAPMSSPGNYSARPAA